MLKGRKLLKINLLVSIILVFGFIITSFLSYNANYRTSLSNVEQVSSLTAESIYYQLTTMFTRPVNISLTMSRDTLLVTQLNEETKQMNNEEYISTLKNYLETATAENIILTLLFLVSKRLNGIITLTA